MAVIGKIRKRTGLLIAIIAIAIMGFLIMDATNSQSGVIRPGSDLVGEVEGYTINTIQFEEKVRAREEERKAQKGSANAQLTDEERRNIRQETWNEFVENAILSDLFDKIGLKVTVEEVEDMTVGSIPHPFVVNQFRNPNTGQFDPMSVRSFIESIDLPDPNTDPVVKRAQWSAFERAIIQDRRKTKLYDIIIKGLYVPEWQKELKQRESVQRVNFDFVYLPLTDIDDEEINISEQEVRDYLKKNMELYQQDASRSIEYVSFDIKASPEDSAMILRDLGTLKKEFTKTENDSIFLRLNSEERLVSKFFVKEEVQIAEVDSLFRSDVGTIVGPFIQNGMYKYAKLLDRKRIADSAKLREIVFDFNTLQNQQQANRKRALFDSVYMLIDSLNQDFGSLMNAFSDDPQSKARGGDIGWLAYDDATDQQQRLFFFNSSKESVKKEVLLQENKLRIVEVVEYEPVQDAIKVGFLSRNILPSEETERVIYAEASKFASENRTTDQFREAAESMGKQIHPVPQIKENAAFIPTIGYQARPVVRWLYEPKTENGDVSRVFSTSEMHLIALVTGIQKKGTKPLDEVSTEIRSYLMKQKKGELLGDKLSNAGSTLDEIASNLDIEVRSASNMSSTNAQIPGSSWELDVVYVALSMEEGEISDPIIGNNGTYIIKVTSKTPVTEEELNVYKQTIKQEYLSSVNQSLLKALTDKAEIEDNRSRFY